MNVWLVFRNADMIEGQGPMILDSVFSTETLANRYMDSKFGIMGRKFKWSELNTPSDWETRVYMVDERA